jgi:hypothetical protein
MTSEVSDRCGLASIRRITPEEAWSLTSEGKAVLVDTRPGSYYGEAHAGGAISMPSRTSEETLERRSMLYRQTSSSSCIALDRMSTPAPVRRGS